MMTHGKAPRQPFHSHRRSLAADVWRELPCVTVAGRASGRVGSDDRFTKVGDQANPRFTQPPGHQREQHQQQLVAELRMLVEDGVEGIAVENGKVDLLVGDATGETGAIVHDCHFPYGSTRAHCRDDAASAVFAVLDDIYGTGQDDQQKVTGIPLADQQTATANGVAIHEFAEVFDLWGLQLIKKRRLGDDFLDILGKLRRLAERLKRSVE